MKLYTEEQVEKILCTAIYIENPQIQSDKVHIEANKYLKQLTPIELPSDEEIEKFANEYVKNKWEYAQDENKESFVECAKWLRNKIQGGNK